MRSNREWEWRRRLLLGAVVLLAVMSPAATGGATASADTLLETINVPLDGSRVYSAPLVAGGVYRIDASGTFTQNVGIDLDAIYCYFSSNPVPGACSPPGHSNLVIVRHEGDPSLSADLDALNPATTLAYNPLHTYQETFTAPSSSRLEVFYKYSPTFFFSGAIRLDLYLVSPPAPAPAPGPGGGGSAGGGASPLLLPAATAWGQTGPPAALAPGGEAVMTSPPIAPSQRDATATLSGDASGKTDVVIAVLKDAGYGVKTGRPTRGDCVRGAVGLYKRIFANDEDDYGPVHEDVRTNNAVLYTTLFLIACLDLVKELDEQTRPAPVPRAAGAARLSCKARPIPVSVQIDAAARKTRWQTRRASRREPVRRLRASCRQARNGRVTLRIRTASRRVKLRKVVGPRLVVGAYRSTAASGTANIRTTFKRR